MNPRHEKPTGNAHDAVQTGSDGPLLEVDALRTYMQTEERTVHAVDGVDFSIGRQQTVGLVGESGSGKSVTARSLTKLLPQPEAKIVGGSVRFEGLDLLGASEPVLRSIRGNRIAHLFQNPTRSLDPVYSVGEQLRESIAIHEPISRTRARERGVELLRRLGIPDPTNRIDDYPHEFSGGMAQRIALAIALSANPDLLVADEPTTAVDVTVQARIIDLLGDLAAEGMAMLLITHDLRMIAALADVVYVMYGGTIVERGAVKDVLFHPSHPYTQALFDSYDGFDRRPDRSARGDIPTTGCRFRDECPHAIDACASETQPAFHPATGDAHAVSCVYYGPGKDESPILEAGGEVRPGQAERQ
ncbi:MAG: ABC transporter ATP-binding protein [Halodesulfurarchaeum sp.]